MNSRQVDDLFSKTLSGDYEDEAPWEAVRALRRLGTREVFEKAAIWCKSIDPLIRSRGVDVLAQLGKTGDHPSNTFPDESFSMIAALIQTETAALPLASEIAALGHLDNPAAVPIIVNFASHPNSKVRFDLAFALGCFPNDSLSVATLLRLMQDESAKVRDWATFGIGVLGDVDSPEIREALVRNLGDSDKDVREEAMSALGKRKDQRVLPDLLAALEQPTVSSRAIEAASQMLGSECEPEGWTVSDYAAALRERFPEYQM